MRASEFITGHVTFKLRYNQIYQMKTTLVTFDALKIKPNSVVFYYCGPIFNASDLLNKVQSL